MTKQQTTHKEQCIVCNEKSSWRGFCHRHYRMLYYYNMLNEPIEKCIDFINEKESNPKYKAIPKKRNKVIPSSLTEIKERIEKGLCLLCDDKHHSRGLCIYHVRNLRDGKSYEVEFYKKFNIEKILKEIRKEKHTCIFCGDKHFAKGFCGKHYRYLKRRTNADFNHTEECIELLKEKFGNIKKNKEIEIEHNKSESKCIICGKKLHAKGFCRNHYTVLRYYHKDTNNLVECIEFIKERESKQKNKQNNIL